MIKVAKFGGSSVANATQFEKVKNIVLKDDQRKFIVTSACGKIGKDDYKITDLLYILFAHIKYKINFSDIINMIITKYENIEKTLKIDINIKKEIEDIVENAKANLDEDYLVSRGEYLTAKLLAKYFGAKFVDAKDLIYFKFDKTIDYEKINNEFSKLNNEEGKIVIPGFYGSMPDGKIKVMTRGGSDITGSIVANAVNADLYENWTDVSGMLVCDPRIVENPKRIQSINYRELREMSFMGANVLHEETILPLKQKKIIINIKNTNDPENPGTMILENCESFDNEESRNITGISGKKDFTIITCTKSNISNEIGFIRKILSIFEKYEISVESCPASVDSVSIIVETENIKNKIYDVLTELRENLQCDSVIVDDNIAQIAIVGRNMKGKCGVAGQIMKELGNNNINIKTLIQSADEICIIIGVKNEDCDKAIKCIYDKFIK